MMKRVGSKVMRGVLDISHTILSRLLFIIELKRETDLIKNNPLDFKIFEEE